MHISSVVHKYMWSKKTKITNVYPFHLKPFADVNNKLSHNFQLVLLFCFKMHAFVFT
jgi:hypothetical protein